MCGVGDCGVPVCMTNCPSPSDPCQGKTAALHFCHPDRSAAEARDLQFYVDGETEPDGDLPTDRFVLPDRETAGSSPVRCDSCRDDKSGERPVYLGMGGRWDGQKVPTLPPVVCAFLHSSVFRSRMRAVKTTPVSLLCNVRGKASTFHTHSSPFRGRFNNPR